MRGSYCIWPDGILFFGRHVRIEWSRPFTASLVFAHSGSMRLRVGRDCMWRSVSGALVAPNVAGELDARGSDLVCLKIDPETDAYARVASRLADGPVHELSPALVAELSAHAGTLLGRQAFSPSTLWEIVLDRVGGPASERRRFDPRIVEVLDLLKANFAEPPSAAGLAERVGLSEGRLQHLFSEQVGVPLRRYVLWLRLRHVASVLMLSGNLTDAAHAAGFFDSAHLSRTFRSLSGISPSDLFGDRDTVKVMLGFPGSFPPGPHAANDAPLWAMAAAALGVGNDVGDAHRWVAVSISGKRDASAFHVGPLESGGTRKYEALERTHP